MTRRNLFALFAAAFGLKRQAFATGGIIPHGTPFIWGGCNCGHFLHVGKAGWARINGQLDANTKPVTVHFHASMLENSAFKFPPHPVLPKRVARFD